MKALNPKQELAKLLYMESNKSQKEIAALVSTSEHTMSGWVKKYKWDLERGAKVVTPDSIVTDLLIMISQFKEVLKTEKRFPTSGEADALVKLASAIEKLDKKLNPSIIMNVMMRFTDEVSLTDAPLAKRIAEHGLAFVQNILKGE